MKRIVLAVLAVILIVAASGQAYALHRETLYKSKIQGFRPEETIDLENGNIFTAADRVSELSTNEQTSFLFHNHSDTVTAYINSISINTTGKALVDIYDSFTITDQGDTLYPKNLYLGSELKSNMELHKNASLDQGDTYTELLETVVPSGSTSPNRSIGGGLNTRVFVVPPGENFIVVLENNSTASADYAINVMWTEKVDD